VHGAPVTRPRHAFAIAPNQSKTIDVAEIVDVVDCFRVPAIGSKVREQEKQFGSQTTMNACDTVSSGEIKTRWVVEEEIDIDDNISCQTGATTVVASNKRIATVRHFWNSSFEPTEITARRLS
jgi:hypothetical protein